MTRLFCCLAVLVSLAALALAVEPRLHERPTIDCNAGDWPCAVAEIARMRSQLTAVAAKVSQPNWDRLAKELKAKQDAEKALADLSERIDYLTRIAGLAGHELMELTGRVTLIEQRAGAVPAGSL